MTFYARGHDVDGMDSMLLLVIYLGHDLCVAEMCQPSLCKL